MAGCEAITRKKELSVQLWPKYNITLIDTHNGQTLIKRLREEVAMQIRSRIVTREFKSGDRRDLYAGTPALEALKAIISIAANYSPEFSMMHVDVSRAYFHAKAQRPRAGEIENSDC